MLLFTWQSHEGCCWLCRLLCHPLSAFPTLGWWHCKADSLLCGARLATTPSLHPGAGCPHTVVPSSSPIDTWIREPRPIRPHRQAFSSKPWGQPAFLLSRVTHGCRNHHHQQSTPPTWGLLTHPRLVPGQLGLCSTEGVPMAHRSGLLHTQGRSGRETQLFFLGLDLPLDTGQPLFA